MSWLCTIRANAAHRAPRTVNMRNREKRGAAGAAVEEYAENRKCGAAGGVKLAKCTRSRHFVRVTRGQLPGQVCRIPLVQWRHLAAVAGRRISGWGRVGGYGRL
eukprot:gene4535-biopygen5465